MDMRLDHPDAGLGRRDRHRGARAPLRARYAREEQIFHVIERIDRKSIKEPQNPGPRLADSVLRHAGNEHSRARLHRDLLSVETHDPGAGEHVVDFRRRVAMQAEPVAGLKFGDAAGHAGRQRQPL